VLGVAHKTKVVSAHRTPERLYEALSRRLLRGLQVIIAGAGGAAPARHGGGDDTPAGARRAGAVKGA
jgi:phosphoribosylcarboxyaminoimidazole (NCAIR) mutase